MKTKPEQYDKLGISLHKIIRELQAENVELQKQVELLDIANKEIGKRSFELENQLSAKDKEIAELNIQWGGSLQNAKDHIKFLEAEIAELKANGIFPAHKKGDKVWVLSYADFKSYPLKPFQVTVCSVKKTTTKKANVNSSIDIPCFEYDCIYVHRTENDIFFTEAEALAKIKGEK